MASYERELRRGTFINTLGLVAKLLEPLFVLFATWLYGPVVVGYYLIAVSLAEISAGFLATGYADATTIFGSQALGPGPGDPEAGGRIAQVLANALVITLALSCATAIAVQLGAPYLAAQLADEPGALLPGLALAGWSLVPFSFWTIVIAATKAHLRMEFDALFGGLRPIILLGTAAVAFTIDDSVTGLLTAWLVTQLVLAALSLWPLVKMFDVRALLLAVVRLRPHRKMLAFAIPQSLNLTLNRYITRLAVPMLAGLGAAPAQIAWYGTASLLTSNLKTIRTVFSGALAPVAARHHQAGEREELTSALGRLSNVTTMLIVPVVLAAVVLRDDVMALADESYRGDSAFVAVLLVTSFINCAYGLAGNCMMFTGHTGWTLTNSVIVAALNTGLAWLLIPAYGLLGAAVATVIAVALVSAAQIVELHLLERVTLRWRDVAGPHLGLGAGLAVVIAVWDPAMIGGVGGVGGVGVRIALALGLASLAVAVAVLVDPRTRASVGQAITKRWTRRPPPGGAGDGPPPTND